MNAKPLGTLILIVLAIIVVAVPGWSQDETPQTDISPMTPQNPQSQQSVIQIEDAVICQNVVDRQPVGAGDVQAKENTVLYCFTRVVGAVNDTAITHNWYYQGTLKSSVQLNVRSPNWRTWSSKTLDPSWTGEWMVEVLSADGTPLESLLFVVQ